jgi:hypothetical protein
MDCAVDEEEAAAIRKTAAETPGGKNVHDIRTCKIGDLIVADAQIEVDAMLTVEAGHDIAVEARRRVMQRHRVLNLMTHVDPWKRIWIMGRWRWTPRQRPVRGKGFFLKALLLEGRIAFFQKSIFGVIKPYPT